MTWGNRYYPDRWNPYNRHDTGMYLVYRKSDGKYLGTVVNCKDEWHAKNIAFNKYNCHYNVDLIEV